MRKAIFILAFLLFLSIFHVTMIMLPRNASATTHFVGGTGAGNLSRIQDAIDLANSGDTVYVYSGLYEENLVVSTALSIIGENTSATVIDGNDSGDVVLVTSDSVEFSGFTVTNSGSVGGDAGIELFQVLSCIVSGNNISNNGGIGIFLSSSHFNTITDNHLSNTSGINIRYSTNNTVSENVLAENSYGIRLYQSTDNEVSSNQIRSSWSNGIRIESSDGNTIASNEISSSKIGIFHLFSVGNFLSNNTMSENGIQIIGNALEHWNTHSIDTSNTVNTRPVYYWKNLSGGTVPSGAGQVILANCHDVVVENQNLSAATAGIQLAYTSDTIVSNNSAQGNTEGISLRSTNGNLIAGNNVSDSSSGIELTLSDHNAIIHNVAADNSIGISIDSSFNNSVVSNVATRSLNGVWMRGSDLNNVINNTVSDNLDGIYLEFSFNNRIYHNNFVGNTGQAYDDGNNSWDNGYPSGGNYWSDYNGVDIRSGPLQDQVGGDGIGDTPYDISSGTNRDGYPLMSKILSVPWEPRNLEASSGNGQVNLSWAPPLFDGGSPITNYRIYSGTISGGEVFLAEIGNLLTFNDAGLTNGQTYYYSVTAVNAVGEGPKSLEANAIPHNQPPTWALIKPVQDEIVSGEYSMMGNSSDEDGLVLMVEIRIDEGQWIQANGTTAWSYNWRSNTVTDGVHTITARSFDGENHSEEVSATIVVDNSVPGVSGDIWLWIAMGVIIAVCVVILLLVHVVSKRRKKNGEGDQEEFPEEGFQN